MSSNESEFLTNYSRSIRYNSLIIRAVNVYSKKFRLPIDAKTRAAKKIFSSPYFLVKASENNRGHNRFGIIISSGAIKKSTGRHFWKRRIADEMKKWHNFGKDFLIIVSAKINEASVNEVRAALRLAEKKIQ